jgi:3-hydroxyacyl-CoA dehydrogenase
MNVTIIGAGNMGRGIGHRLVAGGHSVTIVDRDPEEAGRLAEELRGAGRRDRRSGRTWRGAARRGGDPRCVLPRGRSSSPGNWARGWRAR